MPIYQLLEGKGLPAHSSGHSSKSHPFSKGSPYPMTGPCGVQKSGLMPQFAVTLKAVPASVRSVGAGERLKPLLRLMAGSPILLLPSPSSSLSLRCPPPHISPVSLPRTNQLRVCFLGTSPQTSSLCFSTKGSGNHTEPHKSTPCQRPPLRAWASHLPSLDPY